MFLLLTIIEVSPELGEDPRDDNEESWHRFGSPEVQTNVGVWPGPPENRFKYYQKAQKLNQQKSVNLLCKRGLQLGLGVGLQSKSDLTSKLGVEFLQKKIGRQSSC